METDPVSPLGVYGRSKLDGERRVAAYPRHVILRTAWVYGPHGANFVRTMLRLAETRDLVRVVADQRGNPTSALDIARAVIAVAANLRARPEDASLYGTFHLTGQGDATWADLAEEVFQHLQAHQGKAVAVERISTADYPTPARRPANSRLDCTKLADRHGVSTDDWRAALKLVVDRLL